MNHFEIKLKIMKEAIAMNKIVAIIDPKDEYAEIAKVLGGEVIHINPDNCGVFNPFLAATKHSQTIEEKETELREFLDSDPDFGVEYARQRLNDMSFFDDDPEWKERATAILREYTKARGKDK